MPKDDNLDFEISFYEQLIREKTDDVDTLALLADAYTKKGDYEKGLKIDMLLAVLRPEDPIVSYNLACSLALVRRDEEAIRELYRSLSLGYRDFDHLAKDPDLKNLRKDPRFQDILALKQKEPVRKGRKDYV